jgi:hypothetical protein
VPSVFFVDAIFKGETRLDAFVRQSGIIAQDIWIGPLLRHQIDDQVDGGLCSTNNRFADEDIRVGDDSFLPVHRVSLLIQLGGGELTCGYLHSTSILPERKRGRIGR